MEEKYTAAKTHMVLTIHRQARGSSAITESLHNSLGYKALIRSYINPFRAEDKEAATFRQNRLYDVLLCELSLPAQTARLVALIMLIEQFVIGASVSHCV